MRLLDSAEIDALQAGGAVARDLVWITAKHGSTGLPFTQGYWNGIRDTAISVRDALSGQTVSRSFRGRGALVGVGPIPLTADITIRNVDVMLSQIDTNVMTLVRSHDVRAAPIQIYRVLLDPGTRAPVASAKSRFAGYVDGAPINTPSEGSDGSVTLRCVSATREFTRTNPQVRSHESQLARTGGADDFYIDTAVVGEWDLAWGQKRGPIGGDK